MSYCVGSESAAMHACSLQYDPFAALTRCATCVADPSFPRIARGILSYFPLSRLFHSAVVLLLR